jgi:hypothetical protein
VTRDGKKGWPQKGTKGAKHFCMNPREPSSLRFDAPVPWRFRIGRRMEKRWRAAALLHDAATPNAGAFASKIRVHLCSSVVKNHLVAASSLCAFASKIRAIRG